MHIAQCAGGVEKYILMLLNNMDKEKYENIIVASYDYNEGNYKKIVDIFEYVDMCREINFVTDIKSIISIRKLIKKYQPDVVYMHSSKAGAIGRIANIGLSNVSLYNPHGWSFNMDCSNIKVNIYKYIEKILSLFCTKIIAISNFEKDSALKYKICKKEKINVIFNGVDIDEYYNKKDMYSIDKKELGIPDNAYVFGCVGRISKQKAPDIFIKFASLIKSEIPNSFFIMVGDGEERSSIEQMIKDYKLEDRVLITGWIDEPMKYIKLFDQALLLSRWEGFGLVLTEYMLAQKPIIATNTNAIPDLINDGESGILVKVDDPKGVFDAAMNIYNNPEYAKFIAKNGLQNVKQRFDIKRVVYETDKIILGE